MLVEKDRITVKFIEIRETGENLTRIYFDKILARSDGKEKLWRGAAVVRDRNLSERLKKLQTGAEIEIEIETDWEAEGVPVILIDFFEKCSAENEIAKTNGEMPRKAATGELKFA